MQWQMPSYSSCLPFRLGSASCSRAPCFPSWMPINCTSKMRSVTWGQEHNAHAFRALHSQSNNHCNGVRSRTHQLTRAEFNCVLLVWQPSRIGNAWSALIKSHTKQRRKPSVINFPRFIYSCLCQSCALSAKSLKAPLSWSQNLSSDG